jgi:hypothetical protein
MSEALERRLAGAQAELDALNTVGEDLPALATDALVEGLDTPTLRILAGEPSIMFAEFDNRDLFRKVLEELGREPLPREEALWQLIRFRCWDILQGRVTPIDGARRIERLVYEEPSHRVVGWFVGFSDEWGAGWGRSKAEIEAEIREVAAQVSAAERAEDVR